jgi:hypothetical protein
MAKGLPTKDLPLAAAPPDQVRLSAEIGLLSPNT